MVPHGRVQGIRYVLFVTPEGYFALPTPSARAEVGRVIGRLNGILAKQTFICVGPGRWGTRNPDLGVFIGYADIYNTSALIELAGKGIGLAPEPSFGTHFFQDLIEADIFPLAIYLDDEQVRFNRRFFYHTSNQLSDFLSIEGPVKDCLHLIDVASFRPYHHMDLIMDDEQGRAMALIVPD